jgi:hypothetical protein
MKFNKTITPHIFLIIVMLSITVSISAQLYKYFPDKPGKFIVADNLNNCPGVDIPSLKKNLTYIVEWFHQNDALLNSPKGFNANISMFGNPSSPDDNPDGLGYGIMCSFNISFRYFYAEKDVFHTATGWSAHDFDININQPLNNIVVKQFGDRDFESDDDPRFKQSMHSAYLHLQQFFSAFQIDRQIGPGIKLYKGGHLVIADPNQVEIYIPVTVREIMVALLDYYKIMKEMDSIKFKELKVDSANMQMYVYDMMAKEYANFTPDELNKRAFVNAGDGISGINCNGIGNQVIKFNPDCWDRKLPETAIQFISMNYKPGTKTEMDDFSRDNNQLTDYVRLFMNSLPLQKMGELMRNK